MMHDGKAKQEFYKSGFRPIGWKTIVFLASAFIVFMIILELLS